MVEVIFKAESIQDLKLMIQEYSLAHLGMTPEQLVNLRVPLELSNSKKGQPGVSEEVRLNDGTVRLHNKSYPSKMPNMPEEKRKPGRPKGWRKEKMEAAPEPQPTPMSSPQPTREPTLKDLATKAVNALAIAKGVRIASDAMEKMGAPRLQTTQMAHLKDVPPEKYQELIELCERTALEN